MSNQEVGQAVIVIASAIQLGLLVAAMLIFNRRKKDVTSESESSRSESLPK